MAHIFSLLFFFLRIYLRESEKELKGARRGRSRSEHAEQGAYIRLIPGPEITT